MSTLTTAPIVAYSAASDLLARSHRTRSRVSHTTSGHHGHFPWGLLIGLVVLIAVVLAVVFLLRRRRVSP